MTNEQSQIEFLIDKLLNVSENTIEGLIKLKEAINTSKYDHIRFESNVEKLKNSIETVLEKQKELEKTIETINTISNDVNEIKEKDKTLKKFIIILTGIGTAISLLCQYFNVFAKIKSFFIGN